MFSRKCSNPRSITCLRQVYCALQAFYYVETSEDRSEDMGFGRQAETQSTQRKLRAGDRRGFTLVEILISMVIFMVAVLPAIMVLGKSTSLQRAHNLFIGTCIIKLEAEKAYQSGHAPQGDAVYEFSTGKWMVKRNALGGPLHTVEISIEKGEKEICSTSFLLFDHSRPQADTLGEQGSL